ncbi:uncharacterized protein LOC101894231 isoform X1 [Musca domestica]|uniref:Uncharacterized protein LOC101894231 isoform X1 n=1 Tax=Musca domestica TaxID=7370 RepID=A0A9J7D1F7_MUSDO|nr:uncharacterized protein LOC101894231 isoform X1 [Musca domestica]
MAAINPEDLEKLKKFIDFVSANPLILNVPQLGFMKRFIEKFGGKVPEGEYQMPAGGKCPFGGDAKTETKTQPPPSSTQDADEAEPVVEEESEESEVELDMEEINVQLLEPNVLYLDEKPPKIVKNIKASKRGEKRCKKLTRLKEVNKKKKSKTKKLKHSVVIKNEEEQYQQQLRQTRTSGYETRGAQSKQKSSLLPADDPLCTPSDQEIKMETEIIAHKEEEAGGGGVEDEQEFKDLILKVNEKDYKDLSQEVLEEKDELDNEAEPKVELSGEEFVDEEEEVEEDESDNSSSNDGDDGDGDAAYSDDEDYEDEPLIMLTRNRGRPRKDLSKNFIPKMEQCREKCKQQCHSKFSTEQRRSICDYYWSLNDAQRVQYIRKHIRARCVRLQRKRITNRGGNCCYYLNRTPADADNTANFVRVCRKFFEITLCLRDHAIKKALEGYEPESEIEVIKPLLEQQRASRKSEEKTDEIQQFLDPETGDLITIDPKAKKTKPLSSSSAANEPKKKRVRRKPGDPLPEHHPKPIKCQQRCIQKCHTKFTEEERKQICDIFWSMDYKRRKDYILARIETKEIESVTTPEFRKSNRPPRAYHTRFYLGSGLQGENKRVCKHFMMSTLCISRMFITNAIDFADKNTGCYTGSDRRGGHNTATTKLKPEDKKLILDHISSYPTWMPNKKSKTKYLHYTLNIKRMYLDYKELCCAEEREIMSISYYYKAFHEDFTLSFLTHPEPKRRGGLTNTNPNISHYTGLEPGGMWLDVKGEKLDVAQCNPAESFMNKMLVAPRSQMQQERASKTTSSSAAVAVAAIPPPDNSTSDSLSNSISASHAIATTPNPTPATATQTISSSSGVSAPASSTFNFNQSLSYAHLLDPALNSSFICQPPPSSNVAAAAAAAAVVRHEFTPNIYDSNNLPHAHAASTSSLFRRL